ncbi:MAG TPA: hypothetical protein PLO89_06065, partial [Spirochaetota bacterium]|nr:hypothetical protein [Spirochaetota bacterium]
MTLKRINFIIYAFFMTFLAYSQQNNFYWENEFSLDAGKIGKFEVVKNDKLIGLLYVKNDKTKQIFFRYGADGTNWSKRILLLNDFYGNNPNGVDFSGVVDSENNIYLSYRTKQNKIEIEKFYYDSEYSKREKVFEINSENVIYLPVLFATENDEIVFLFLENTNKDVKIRLKKIDKAGALLTESTIGDDYKNPLNPFITERNGKLFVVFQAKDRPINEVYFYNIILGFSEDGGANWRYETLVDSTGENNQRPHLFIDNKAISLVWEKEDENLISHIIYRSFNFSYQMIDEFQVSSKFSEAHMPFILKYNDFINFFWYDSLRGTFQTYWNYIDKIEVTEAKLLRNKNGRTSLIYPLLYKNKPFLIWLQSESKENVIYCLKSDGYVEIPKIFASGDIKKIGGENITNNNNIFFSWNELSDIAGIKGYRTLLTKEPEEEISEDEKMIFYNQRSLSYKELIDGVWYFKLKAYDNAGNESKTAVYKFEIDTIEPETPAFIKPASDESGDL